VRGRHVDWSARRQENGRRDAHRPLMREQSIIGPARIANMLVDVYDWLENAGSAGGCCAALAHDSESEQGRGSQEFSARNPFFHDRRNILPGRDLEFKRNSKGWRVS
jgi:hypothetical protein